MANNKKQKIEKVLKKAKELGIDINLDNSDIITDAKLEKDEDGEWKILITYTKSLKQF